MRLWDISPAGQVGNTRLDGVQLEAYCDALAGFLCEFIAANNVDDLAVDYCRMEVPGAPPPFGANHIVSPADIKEMVYPAVAGHMSIRLKGKDCRFFSFGFDYDAWLCVRNADLLPAPASLLRLRDISMDLIETDWYDT